MRYHRAMMLCLSAVLMSGWILVPAAAANETAVEINVPAGAAAGDAVVITLNVSHEGNNFIHHTEWVALRIDGQTVKRWEYGMFSKPPSENFSVSFTYTAADSFEIEAQGSCNLHGSRNVATKMVTVESAPGSEASTEESQQ